jgi:hypothetical protein
VLFCTLIESTRGVDAIIIFENKFFVNGCSGKEISVLCAVYLQEGGMNYTSLFFNVFLKSYTFLPPYKPARPISKNIPSPIGAPAPGGLLPAAPCPTLGGGGGGCDKLTV